MPLTIQDVRREVRTALSRISIIDSDTIQVVSGDKPLQPSVRTGALSGVGDIFGPTLTTVNAIAIWANTDGTSLADSPILIDPATGELDLDGNKLVLSADGLSHIHSLVPNLVDVKVGNVSIFTWQNNLVAVKVPLVLFGNDLEFGNLATITSPAAQQLNVVMNSVVTVDFREAQTVLLVDLFMGENEILLGNTGNTSIRGAVDVATLKINGTDQVEWSDGLMEVGEGGAAYTISSKSGPFSGPGLFTIAGGDAIFEAVGGTLKLRGGAGHSDVGGTVQLASVNGVVRLEVNEDGTIDINGSVININGSIAGLPSIQIDNGGIIGFDNDNKWVLTEDLLHSWTINGVLAMTLADDTLDGQGTTRLTGFKGMREQFTLGYPSTSTATTQWTYAGPFSAITTTSAKRGAYMFRSGSIVKINIVCDVNVVGSGDTLDGQGLINNVSTTLKATITGLVVGNGKEADNSQALGIDTFSAGDYISAKRVLTGASPGQVTTDDFIITVEVEYD